MKRAGPLAAIAAALSLAFGASPAAAQAQAHPIPAATARALAANPGVPFAGPANGDVTVIEFMDYNCPYCRRLAPELTTLMTADPKVRVLYKDWPIFGGVSVYAAKVALAAGWQGKYLRVHDALIGSPGRLASEQQVRGLAKAAGVDLARLDLDLKAHDVAIDAILKRNSQEAESLTLEGTPGVVIGSQLVFGGLPEPQLRQLVLLARRGS
jgi:protein-disulfide isomerase